MERMFDGKLYPKMKVVFHRIDDGSETVALTVDIAGVPVGYAIFSNHIISMLIDSYDCKTAIKELEKKVSDLNSVDIAKEIGKQIRRNRFLHQHGPK
jgi:hypothetical protein